MIHSPPPLDYILLDYNSGVCNLKKWEGNQKARGKENEFKRGNRMSKVIKEYYVLKLFILNK